LSSPREFQGWASISVNAKNHKKKDEYKKGEEGVGFEEHERGGMELLILINKNILKGERGGPGDCSKRGRKTS